MTIQETIKAARIDAGLTQKALGIACGYDEKNAERMIQKWERAEQGVPITRIRRLATALNIPLDSLIP